MKSVSYHVKKIKTAQDIVHGQDFVVAFVAFCLEKLYYKQLLTIEALGMMLCRPENTNIDLSSTSVNIGTLSPTSHHVQCLNSQ